MALARTRPTRTARNAVTRGFPDSCVTSPRALSSLLNDDGRYANAAMSTRSAETIAEMKKPRLIPVRPERSPSGGRVARKAESAGETAEAGAHAGKARRRVAEAH